MNVKEYIQSGILENYVLGSVSDQERREVECIASIYPEIREELESLSVSMNAYAEIHRVNPPTGLKQKILAELEDLSDADELQNVVEMRAASAGVWKYAVAASIAIVLVLSFVLFNTMNQVDSLSEQLSGALSQNQELSSASEEDQALIKQLQEANKAYYAVIKDPNNKIVHMHEAEGKPDALTLVYWNPTSKEVYVQVDHMHIPSDELQYQLWAIVDGEAIDAGVFEVGEDSTALQKMKPTEKADAFVVTLEKRGGVPVAEGEIYALGNT